MIQFKVVTLGAFTSAAISAHSYAAGMISSTANEEEMAAEGLAAALQS